MATYDYGHNGAEVVQPFSDYVRLSATSSATILASPGRIVGAFCSALGDGAKLTIRDQTASANSSQVINNLAVASGTFYNFYNVRCKTGIFVNVGSATGSDITIFYLPDTTP